MNLNINNFENSDGNLRNSPIRSFEKGIKKDDFCEIEEIEPENEDEKVVLIDNPLSKSLKIIKDSLCEIKKITKEYQECLKTEN